jgi:hypothetical protein
VGALALAGCGIGGDGDLQQVDGDVSDAAAPPATASTIAFQTFSDDVGDRAATENRTLIRTARGYQSFFGHAPPASVDFSREWVIFYAAGTKPTGGYDASVLAVLRSGGTLIAITELASPGAGCAVTLAQTSPHVLVKFPAQPGSAASFFKQDRTQDCPSDGCAAVLCPAGSTCDPTTGKCSPAPVRCGGLGGIACPGLGRCVDDPSDSCDPNAGGNDCGGVCSCVQNVLCTTDSKFDSSPAVCACVPVAPPPPCPPVCDIYCEYGNVADANGCPTCKCNPPPNACAAVLCPAGSTCDPATGKCITTNACAAVLCPAGSACDPATGKCIGAKVACGGFTGKPCPGFGRCVDDPSDSCDPAAGGADCAGICSCVQNVLCTTTSTFDSSPSVCTCVPNAPPPTCPPEKCPGPGPLAPTMMCADGTTAGPTCAVTASGACGWTVTTCPAP